MRQQAHEDTINHSDSNMPIESAPTPHPVDPKPISQSPWVPVLIGTLSCLLLFTAVAIILVTLYQSDEPIMIGDTIALLILGMLAFIGVFFIIATGFGLFKTVAPRQQKLPLSALQELKQAIAIVDENNIVVFANDAYKALMQNDDAAIAPVNYFRQFSSARTPLYHLTNAALNKRNEIREIRIDMPVIGDETAHKVKWLDVEVSPLNVDEQSLTLWQIEDKSRLSGAQEQAFHDLQEAINHLDKAPIGFCSVQTGGQIGYLNATLADWLQLDLGEIDSRELSLADILDPASKIVWESHLRDAQKNTIFELDVDFIRHDATLFAGHIVCQIFDNGDKDTGVQARFVVLDRQSYAVAPIGEGQQDSHHFNRFFEKAPLAMTIVDAHGQFQQTNAHFVILFAHNAERAQLQKNGTMAELLSEGDYEAFQAQLDAVRQNRQAQAVLDIKLSQPQQRYIRFYISKLSDAGQPFAAIVLAVEMTEQKTLEEQIVQTQKMQAVGQLAGGIAHDFNNVLTTIIVSSDLLLNNLRRSDPMHPDIWAIRENAARAANLVQKLLAFSRRQTLRPVVFDLTDELFQWNMLVQRLLGPNITLKIDHGRDLWPVKADPAELERVILNLASNARDAMPDGGQVVISTRNIAAQEVSQTGFKGLLRQDYVALEFRDTGSGIDAAIVEKIFEPFFTTKEVGKGTGLGLSMVYGIIKQTGGDIFCTSQSGQGTTFHIFLPRYSESSDANLGAQAISAPSAASHMVETLDQSTQTTQQPHRLSNVQANDTVTDLTGSARVLLVEDEDAVRMGAVRALQSRGYTVFEAENGLQALEILDEEQGNIDIIVSDVVMPEMDGPTLLRELRKNYPDIKFIFVSGYAEDAFAKNLPEDAKFGFLPKPYSLKELALAVKNMLAQA